MSSVQLTAHFGSQHLLDDSLLKMSEWMILHNSGLRADAAGFFFGIKLFDQVQKFTSLCLSLAAGGVAALLPQ